MLRLASVGTALLAGATVTALAASPALATTTTHPTSLTLKAAHASVAPKHKDRLTATLKAGTHRLAGEPVYLESRSAGAKKFSAPVSIGTTDAKGTVSVSVVPGRRKGHREQYRVIFKGDAKYGRSHSAVITLTVG